MAAMSSPMRFSMTTSASRRGSPSGVGGAGLADGEGADGDAGGHLDDRQQAVLAAQRPGLHRNTEDRQGGHRGDHARQVRGAAGPGDDDLEALGLGALGEFDQPVGRPVGGNDTVVVGNFERIERFGGVLHGRPVGLAAHDDGDRRLSRHPGAPVKPRV